MAGRPRKPADLKKTQGTYHKSRNCENEAKYEPVKVKPKCPPSLNKAGAWLWELLAPELMASGVLTNPDLPAFELLCGHYGRAKELEALLSKNFSSSIENENGALNAQARQMNTELAACVTLMNKFGLTPADRNKFGVGKPEKESEDVEKMKGLLGA